MKRGDLIKAIEGMGCELVRHGTVILNSGNPSGMHRL